MKTTTTLLIRFFLPILALLTNTGIVSGQSASVEMADALRQDGKIYVVVACVFVIVSGLVVYLISLDGKISKLEKNNQIKP